MKHQLAPLGQFEDVKIGLHGIHLPCNQLNIVSAVPLVGIDPINARIRRNMTNTFGKRQWYSTQRTKAVLLLQEKGQKLGIDVALDLVFSGADSRGTYNVGEMVSDAAGTVAGFLVS